MSNKRGLDDTKIDNSIMKGDFTKIDHQHGAQEDNEKQTRKFYFGKKPKNIQVSMASIEHEIEIETDNRTNFTDADDFRLVKTELTSIVKESRISNSSGAKIELNKQIGPVSTAMRLFTKRSGNIILF